MQSSARLALDRRQGRSRMAWELDRREGSLSQCEGVANVKKLLKLVGLAAATASGSLPNQRDGCLLLDDTGTSYACAFGPHNILEAVVAGS